MARCWKASSVAATSSSRPSGAHIARTISGAPFTQRIRRPVRPLRKIVAMYLRSVEKVIRSTIAAPSRSGPYSAPRLRRCASSAPSVGLPMMPPRASRWAVVLAATVSANSSSASVS